MVKAIIDLKKSVYELVSAHPEVGDVLFKVGLEDIKKPGILNTMGRFVTIPKGASMKGVSLDIIVTELKNEGFEVINDDNN